MRWKLAAGWVAAQLLFFAGWAAVEQRRHTVGAEILVRTAPVDPRDFLSGQYLALSYEFSRGMTLRDVAREPNEGDQVWVVLKRDGRFHVPDYAMSVQPEDLPDGSVAVVGRRDKWRTLFGIEKYFVPEGTETPQQGDTTVKLRVSPDGVVRIHQVLVRGNPWP
jgi:uncharacterized membrane-anchored protein